MIGKVIAVDFDNTITKSESVFPEMLEPNIELVKKMREWSKNNVIVIWTCRSGKYIEPMIDYLIEWNIPFNYINDNPHNSYVPQSRKVYADVYIDDRSVNLDFMGIDTVDEIVRY